ELSHTRQALTRVMRLRGAIFPEKSKGRASFDRLEQIELEIVCVNTIVTRPAQGQQVRQIVRALAVVPDRVHVVSRPATDILPFRAGSAFPEVRRGTASSTADRGKPCLRVHAWLAEGAFLATLSTAGQTTLFGSRETQTELLQ